MGAIIPVIKLAEGIIAAGGTAVTVPIYVNPYAQKTFYVKTDKQVNVYVKGGWNEDNLCNLKTGDKGGGSQAEDADLVWECNDEMICFPIETHISYMQVVLDNQDGSNAANVECYMGGRSR